MTNNIKKITNSIPLIFLLVTFFLTLCQATSVMNIVIETSYLFLTKLFPCMFIFYTLSDLLLNYGIINIFNRLFKTLFKFLFNIDSTSSFIILMSLFTGFPSGSKYIADFYNKGYISNDLANYLITFTHFSNPLFILGTVKSLYNSKFALVILISHYLSNFILAILIRPKKYLPSTNLSERKKTSLITCLNNSFESTFSVAQIVFCSSLFFVVLVSLLTAFINNNIMKTMLFGLFDLTKGTTDLALSNLSLFNKGIILLTFISLGGVAINIQVQSLISNTNIKYSNFLKGRIASTSLALILYIMIWHFVNN